MARIAAVGTPPFRAGYALAIVAMLVACTSGGNVEPSPSPSGVTATATASPSASPTEAPTAQAEAPDASASPTTAALRPPDGWEPALTVANEDEMVIARGGVRGADGYLAAAEGFVSQEGGPRIVSKYFWRSVDGRAWQEIPAPLEVVDWLLVLSTTADGDFIIIARVYDEAADLNRTVAKRSADGITWTEVDSGLPDDLHIFSIDHGGIGSLLVAEETPADGSADLAAWLSADGITWEKVLDLDDRAGWVTVQDGGAGAEGFVVAGTAAADDNNSHEYFAFASADGRSWTEAEEELFGATDPQFRPDPFVAPLGPDWLAFLHRRDGAIRVFRSANGLDWTETGLIEREDELNVFAPVATEIDGRLYFSTAGIGVAPGSGQAGLWTSTDGAAWEPMKMGSDAYLGGITSHEGTAVAILTQLVGDGSDVEIWIGPTD